MPQAFILYLILFPGFNCSKEAVIKAKEKNPITVKKSVCTYIYQLNKSPSVKFICWELLKKQDVSCPECSQRLPVGTVNVSLLLLTDLSFTPLAFSLQFCIHMQSDLDWSKWCKANVLAPFPGFYPISGGKVSIRSPRRASTAAAEECLNQILMPKLPRTPSLSCSVYGAMNPYGFKVKQKSWFIFLILQLLFHFWASYDFAYLSIKLIMTGISCHQGMLCG